MFSHGLTVAWLEYIPKMIWFVIPREAVIQRESFYALEKLLIWRLCQCLKRFLLNDMTRGVTN